MHDRRTNRFHHGLNAHGYGGHDHDCDCDCDCDCAHDGHDGLGDHGRRVYERRVYERSRDHGHENVCRDLLA